MQIFLWRGNKFLVGIMCSVSHVIWQLLQLRDKFDDPRWKRAMELMEEAYRDRPVSYGLSFYEKNPATDKDELIPLSLPSLPVEVNDELKRLLKSESGKLKTDNGELKTEN